jgi:hypothetical protein
VALGVSDRGSIGCLGRAQRYVRRAILPNPRRFFSYEFFFALEAERLFTAEFRAAIDLEALAQACYDRAQAASELNRLLCLDLKFAIGDNDLLKVTRTAELARVNVRFPKLDLDLVEFTGTLPVRFKLRGLQRRCLFKRALRDLLPRETLAKHKHGFGVPTSMWLRNHAQFQELVRETLFSARARARGYFRPGAVEDLLDAHRKDTTTPYYEDLLWRILMLELWQRNAIAITVDDGYRDNLTHAAPILAHYGLPATIFLTIGFIGTSELPWFDRLAMAFKTTTAVSVSALWGDLLELRTTGDRLIALGRALAYLKGLAEEEFLRRFEQLLHTLAVEKRQCKGWRLEWDDVLALRG